MSAGHHLYVWLAGLFVTALLMANITGVKMFRFEVAFAGLTIPVEHTAGMLSFPITFVLTDLLNEYYGRRGARRVVWLAFVMGFVAFVLIGAARAIPILEGIPGTATAGSFENIFGAAASMYLASLAAFLLGSLLDIFLFAVFKRLTAGRMIWLRATGSTVISQMFDSFLVTFFFFDVAQWLTGQPAAPFDFVLRTAATGYVLKFVIAVVLTPVIYLGRWLIRTQVGLTPLPPERVF